MGCFQSTKKKYTEETKSTPDENNGEDVNTTEATQPDGINSGQIDPNHRQTKTDFNNGTEGSSQQKTDAEEPSHATNQTGQVKLSQSNSRKKQAPDYPRAQKADGGGPNEPLNQGNNDSIQGNTSNKDKNLGNADTEEAGQPKGKMKEKKSTSRNNNQEVDNINTGQPDPNQSQSDADFNDGTELSSQQKTDVTGGPNKSLNEGNKIKGIQGNTSNKDTRHSNDNTEEAGQPKGKMEEKRTSNQVDDKSLKRTAPDNQFTQKPDGGGQNEPLNQGNKIEGIQGSTSNKETKLGNDNTEGAGQPKSEMKQNRSSRNSNQTDDKSEKSNIAPQTNEIDQEQTDGTEEQANAQSEKTSEFGTQIKQDQTGAKEEQTGRDTETNQGGTIENKPKAAPRKDFKKYEEMKKRCKTADQELERQKADIKQKDDKIKELEKSISDLEEELKETRDRADKIMNGKGNNDKSKINDNIATLNNEIAQLKNQLSSTKAEKKKMEQEKLRIKSEKDEMKKKNDIDHAKQVNEITKLEKEKEDLLLRLSEMAGRRLTDNNPNIADLSDVNRPTKLAEKYAELYDNEWTDAYSYLETLEKYKGSEISVIASLLTMLSTAYKVSLKIADKQLEDLRNILNDFHGNISTQDQRMKDLLKQLKDLRKKAVQPSKELKEEYSKEIKSECPNLDSSSLECDALRVYLQKCLELCWLMVIQDPPVHLNCEGCKKGDPFDKNMFKEYTQAGPFIKFIVWPAVYLEMGGALLCKGVVQCDKQLSGSLRAPGKTASNESWKSKSVRLSGEEPSLSLLPSGKPDFGESDKIHRGSLTAADKQKSTQQNAQATNDGPRVVKQITYL